MSVSGISGGMPDFSAMRAAMQERLAATYEAANTDGEDGLTLEEFSNLRPGNAANSAASSKVEEAFAALDADSSGSVSMEELQAGEGPEGSGPPPGGRKGPPPGGGGSVDWSSDMMTTLLSLQEEESSETSELDLLLSSTEVDETDDSDATVLEELLTAG